MSDIGLTYIRGYYRVPADLGVKVRFDYPEGISRVGMIVGSEGPHLMVKLDDDGQVTS